MKRLVIMSIAGMFCFTACTWAVEGDSLWSRTYGGEDDEMALSLIQTADGGYLLAGWSESSSGYWEDAYLVKTNAQGDTLWTRFIGGSGQERIFAASQTPDGGYMLGGFTGPGGVYTSDMWLLRTDAQGDSLWSRTYGGSENEEARAMTAIPGGGFLLAGYTDSYGAGLADIWVVRVEASGDTLWTRTFGGAGTEWASAVLATADGGFLVAGPTNSFIPGQTDAWLIKLNATGDSVWSRTYGGDWLDHVESVIQTADGGYLMVGETISFGAQGYDLWLLKMDANGDSIWSHLYGGMGGEEGEEVIQTSDGGYLAAGITESYGAGSDDMYLVKTDAEGGLLWYQTLGGSANDAAYALLQNSAGDYVLAGSTWSFSGGNRNDVWLVAVEGPAAGIPADPAIPQPTSFALPPCYPNPFNSSTALSYELRAVSQVSLTVYDTAGRLVGTLVDERQAAGEHSVRFDGSRLASGIYLARLEAGEYRAVQKLVLLN